jgi:hypothetical protein
MDVLFRILLWKNDNSLGGLREDLPFESEKFATHPASEDWSWTNGAAKMADVCFDGRRS